MSTDRNLSLWQIKGEYLNLLSKLYDHETGEIDTEVDTQLNALSDTAENKCIAIASWIKRIELDKKQIDHMKEEIIKRETAYQKEINKRLDYLKHNMESLGMTEIKCPYFTLKIKKNPFSANVLDESKIPEKFMRTKEIIKTEIKPDKNAIKEEVLKTGVQVPGVIVEQKTELKILVDKI